MPRLFVAVELPEEVKDRLASLCHGLKGARWVRDRQFHITLRFLGEVEPSQARSVTEALHGVRSDPFELSLSGLGCFPPRGRPRVVWAGIEGSEELLGLHREVQRVLRRCGFGPEDRKFAPHVTLGRLTATPAALVARYVTDHVDLWTEPFPVTAVTLFASTLARGGAQHVPVASYPLFGRAPG